MKDYNGILICRERRQIDCITPPWTKFQNYDANVKVEIDFDPELDEFFGITTAKQQIVIADEMWEKLKHSGKNGGALRDLVEDLRKRFKELQSVIVAEARNQADKDEPRPSERAMEESAKFKDKVPEPSLEQKEEAQKNLEREAKDRADRTGKPKEDALQEIKQETSKKRWEIEFATIPDGPFYRPKRLGEQKRLIINTDHPFYTKLYDTTPDVQAALEVLLFVLAERELESLGDAETFYKAERQKWSERLRHAFDLLVPDEAMADKAAAVAEHMYAASESGPQAF
jgi:hypothetical protein